MKRQLVVVVTCVVSLVASLAFAQSAQLSGLVVDQTGGVMAKAAVVVLNSSTGASRTTETNNTGLYSVPSLPPGTYDISIRIQGFRPVMRNGVTLEVGQNARLDFTLEPATTQEAITVSADASRINTTDGAIGTVIDRQFVDNLPMNGRSFQSLVLLTPGIASNTPQSGALVGSSGEFSVNGQRTEANRFTVDGVSANNGTYVYGYATAGTGGGLPTGTATGTTQSLVSIDALQEFRITSSSYSAEFGRSPGGQFSFVTRSGSNTPHGSVFDYVRNDALDANDWFNNRFAVKKPIERQNDFGGTFGGPITIPGFYAGRDRSFFFFSYEGMRIQQPLAATVVNVPSLSLRQQAPAALQGPLNGYPLPNGADLTGGLSGLSEYVMTDSLPSHLDATSLRLDHNVASSLRLFFRYSHTPSDSVTRSVTYYETKHFSPSSYTFGATSPLSNRLSNELRLGYSTNEGGIADLPFGGDGARPIDLYQAAGVDHAANPMAYVFVGLYFPGSTSGVTQSAVSQRQRQLNFTETLDLVAGQHLFKFGVDYLRTASDLQRTDPYTYNLFNSAAAVLANSSYSAGVIRFGETHPVFSNLGAFVQDEWRPMSRLSVSLGVRWEVSPAPYASEGSMPRVVTGSVYQPTGLALAPDGTPMWKTTYNNFAPRVGMAYVLRDSASFETVLRAGGGIFFDNAQNTRNAAFDSNPGVTATKSYANVSYPLTPAQLNVSLDSSLQTPYSVIYTYGDPAAPLKLPYTTQYNVSLEQALGSPQSLTLSYVGARGERLLEWDTRTITPFNPAFTTITVTRNGLTSSYDALQVQLQRRLSHGLQALSSYTWSHAIDYGSDNRTLAARKGDSAFDVRHNFTAAATYELPLAFKSPVPAAVLNHWSIDGRFTARSAFPVTLNGSTLTDPGTGMQFYGGLDLVPGVPLYIDRADLPGGRQINPAAFKLPATGVQGTAPRNFVRGFGATQLDAVLRRDFPLARTFKLQFRAEMFNVFNHPNFGLINTAFGNPLFGQATKMLNSSLGGLSALHQQGGPRSTQLSLRLQF